ncbi:flagellar biosynthesis protein FlhF [Paenibacillus sp. DS2015]|uniref:flagellar biosynthesis protein FlhF n=1 Tax=Paenibacillus sp. DS2015 TaxID=3373917 RepID=UPI003D1B5939
MRVKRYVVDNMPEAMLKIRNDLGSDAVMLSTKEIKVGGFLGMFRKKRIEVMAAVENDGKTKPSNSTKLPRPVQQTVSNYATPAKAVSTSPVPTLAVPRKSVPEAYRRTTETLSAGMKGDPVSAENLDDFTVNKSVAAALDISDMRVITQPSIEPAQRQPETSFNNVTGDVQLLEEIREMKLWMAKMSRHSTLSQELPAPLQSLQELLIQQEVDQELRDEWLEEAMEKWEQSGNSMDEQQIKQFIRDKLGSFLSKHLGGGIEQDTRIVYIAGPTGVGKTTTIAKLAAEQLFRYQRKVGFITSDTYRISAVEQLRTYASILNVPLEVVQSPGDMQRAMQRLDYCDLILMDTAGRNYRNEMLVSELQSLLSPVGNSETYLVLSLTSKSQDMIKITEHFSKYGLNKIIFTKQDETASYGSILNLLHHYPLHLSYLTNGQNVPDDLMLLDENLLCELLLGVDGS